MKTHVAYLTSQYPATSHTFISREARAVRQLGIELDTFSIRPPSPAELQNAQIRTESESTFTLLRQPARSFISAHLRTFVSRPASYLRTLALALKHRPPGMRGFALSLAHFAEAVLLAVELKRRNITHLHNHFANSAATVGHLASSLLRLPWSFTLHGISETDYPAGLMLARKIEAAKFVACVSYFGRAQAMRLVAPSQWPKLHLVRCGLQFDVLPKHAPGGEGARTICVGRLSPEKGQAGLLQAFAAVASEHPDLDLLFIGDGPEAGELQRLASKLDQDDRIHFAGRMGESDTLDAIARSDILVLPSFMEGLPVVLMEAMALGTAVIASHVAGIPELVEHGENGLLFAPSDWQELASCMRALAGDRELRARLAVGARQRVAAEFDIRRSAEQMLSLFRGEKSR